MQAGDRKQEIYNWWPYHHLMSFLSLINFSPMKIMVVTGSYEASQIINTDIRSSELSYQLSLLAIYIEGENHMGYA